MKKATTVLLVTIFALTCSSLVAQVKAPTRILPNGLKGSPMGQTIPLDVICQPCAIPENEPYILEDGIDVTNPGCFETPNLFSNINLGQVYCSNVNTYLLYGTDPSTDLDWYKLVLTQPATVYFSIYSSIAGQMYILGPPCSDFAMYNYLYSGPGVASVSATLAPGTYYLVYGAYYYLGNGVGVPYMATVTTAPVGDPSTWCPAAQIPTLSEWGLIILGLALLGFGTMYLLRWRGTSA